MLSPNILHWKSVQPKKVKWVWYLGLNLGETRSKIVNKTKKLVFQWGFFFHILREVYIYKLKVVVIEIPEWKLKTKLARNTILKEIKTKYLPILGQK